MKKVQKVIKNNVKVIVAYLIGVILSSGVVYGAIVIQGTNVGYTDNNNIGATTVQAAIDKLYTKLSTPAAPSSTFQYNMPYGFFSGKDVNNYATFNNQTGGWRILGRFNDQYKLISTTPISGQVWNSSTSNTDWSSSSLSSYLNGTYYNGLTSGAKNMIDNGTWWVGNGNYSNYSYNSFNLAMQTKWTGKVGTILMYELQFSSPIKAGSNYCWAIAGSYTAGSGCGDLNWLAVMTKQKSGTNDVWLMNKSSTSGQAVYIQNNNSLGPGYVQSKSVTTSAYVYPVIYLKSTAKITGGNGTTSHPYTFG